MIQSLKEMTDEYFVVSQISWAHVKCQSGFCDFVEIDKCDLWNIVLYVYIHQNLKLKKMFMLYLGHKIISTYTGKIFIRTNGYLNAIATA